MPLRLRRALAGLAVAFVALAALEGGLRLAGFGARQPLLLQRVDALGRAWVLSNPAVGANWFRGEAWEPEMTTPRALRFAPDKPAGTFRVFVVGESAAYGTPWPQHAAWPAMLEASLEAAGGRDVEVLNAGIRASALDIQPALVREICAWAPDLLVLYAGHNEHYGVREPGPLADLRIFQAVEARMGSGADGRVGMRADHAVPPGDPEHARVAARAATDLRRVIAAAEGIPLIVVMPTANERDLAPVGSWVPAGREEAGTRAEALVATVEAAPHEATRARGELGALEAELPEHAGIQHGLGLAAYVAGDAAEARRRFRAATDLDTVPIRARSDTVAALREAAQAAGEAVRVCDPEPALRAASQLGVFDHELFLDHVHLTLEGGTLVSRELARCIGAHPALGFPIDEGALPSLAALRSALGIADVDLVWAWTATEHYFQHATVQASPSRDRSIAYFSARRLAEAARLDPSTQAALGGLADGDVHGTLAAAFAPSDPRRLAELRLAVLARPDHAEHHADLADALLATGDLAAAREEAVLALLHGLSSPGAFAARHGLR